MSEMYLKLIHGRTSPDEQLSDWGTDGPVFGPLEYVHTTYASDVRILSVGSKDDPDELSITKGGLLYYGGAYYGDWTVFVGPLDHHDHKLLQRFDPVQAVLTKNAA